MDNKKLLVSLVAGTAVIGLVYYYTRKPKLLALTTRQFKQNPATGTFIITDADPIKITSFTSDCICTSLT